MLQKKKTQKQKQKQTRTRSILQPIKKKFKVQNYVSVCVSCQTSFCLATVQTINTTTYETWKTRQKMNCEEQQTARKQKPHNREQREQITQNSTHRSARHIDHP